MVGERAMIHNLQEKVVDVWMCFLNFVPVDYAVRLLRNSIREQAALIIPNVALEVPRSSARRYCAHILTHVKSRKVKTELVRQLTTEFSFADARRPSE